MEKELPIFTAALELPAPWFVREVMFTYPEGGGKVLHIFVDHEAGCTFAYEGSDYPVYDHRERIWQHLNFFQHKCHLHAGIPRVKLADGKVKQVPVPWASEGSAFTLLFEQLVVLLLQGGMSASAAGHHLGIGDKRVFRIVHRKVSQALTEQALEKVKELSIDETSSKKGHNYFTVLCDREAKKVVGISIGKDREALAHAMVDMEVRGAYREEVKTVTMDMSPSYISGTAEWMPKANIVFDRFHLTKKLNEAIDEIRRKEQKQFKELKNSRYLWLRNHDKLRKDQQQQVDALSLAYPTIGAAYRLKELFREVFNNASKRSPLAPLNSWIKEAWETGLAPIKDFVSMLHRHWYGVKNYFMRQVTNAYAERVNLKIQEIKRVAKGYRNPMNYMTMIYFHLGGLNILTHTN
jgi:transposase